MKKVSYFIVASLFAVSSVFVSCSDDDDDKPSIRMSLNKTERTEITIQAGESVEFKGDYTADAGIKQIDFEEVGKTNLDGFPKKSGFTSSTVHLVNMTITYPSPGKYTYSTRITDKNDNSANTQIVITVEGEGAVAGEISKSTAVIMAGQGSTSAGSYATSTNKLYKSTEAVANSTIIDFIYYYHASNLAEIFSPKSANALTLAGYKDMSPKNDTKFKKITMTEAEFTAIENDTKIVEVATSLTEEVITKLVVGDIVAFKTGAGKLGVYRVTALTANISGSITIDVKVQK